MPKRVVCITSLNAVARAMPDSEAVRACDGPLSNAESDNLLSKAAQRLALFGIRNGKHVPFALEESLWTVVATLANLEDPA